MSRMIREYVLRDEHKRWLAQVLITEDGMFAAVSEYGNFSYSWRNTNMEFRQFLLSIDEGYFADKMQTGMAYILQNQKVATACRVFAKKILPALKNSIQADLSMETPE